MHLLARHLFNVDALTHTLLPAWNVKEMESPIQQCRNVLYALRDSYILEETYWRTQHLTWKFSSFFFFFPWQISIGRKSFGLRFANAQFKDFEKFWRVLELKLNNSSSRSKWKSSHSFYWLSALKRSRGRISRIKEKLIKLEISFSFFPLFINRRSHLKII